MAIEVSIVRTGGALVGRSLRYFVEPGGEAEFYGSTNIIRFEPGVVKQTTNILARGDGVPEVNHSAFWLNRQLIYTGMFPVGDTS